MGSKITGQKRERVVKLYGSRCYLCGILCVPATSGRQLPNALTIDHVISLFRGGTSDEDNLAVACARCNNSKCSLGLGDEAGLEALRVQLLFCIPLRPPFPYTRYRRSRRRRAL